MLLEVFNNLFMNIAEQMGLQLQNTAYSVNIKERLDFSCALFDAEGNLIANAPHMPVHLGSMGESIKTVIRENAGTMPPGDVYVLNDPYHGGTHLPDVTVITPVYLASGPGDEPLFYVGSRGHHADIGGTTPGLHAALLHPHRGGRRADQQREAGGPGRVARGRDAGAAAKRRATRSATPKQNLADLKAQIAANEKGVQELRRMVDAVRPGGGAGLHAPRAGQRRGIGAARDHPPEGRRASPCRWTTARRSRWPSRSTRRSAAPTIDFTGTSPQQTNNFNAPTAVCMAAVLYVFRTLVDDDIPLNAGCLKPLKVIIPPGTMLNPNPPASVVAGNVETSTCITNTLYGALGVMAAGQCTMNNFTFGNERHQYYETISGGSGAGGVYDAQGRLVGGFDGTSVVQTHMTNSRLTDPEVLEFRFPVRLESYEIRAGFRRRRAAGAAATAACGACASSRPMTASILSNGRRHPAFGMAGGHPGQVGINRVVRQDGSVEPLEHIGSAQMAPGDVFEVHTPGGGGFGAPTR